MVQDDEGVGLDGLGVKFDDERPFGCGCDAGRDARGRLGIEALAGVWCGCARAAGAANAVAR